MATHDVVRRLAAIFVADAVGYSRLMGVDEMGTHTQFKADFEELLSPKIEEFRGRIIKKTGDGLLAEFASVVDAVECAERIQRSMLQRNGEVPKESRLDYRIAINLGEIIVESDDIYGDDVNIAVRIERLAEPGGISLSSAAYQNVRNRLDLQFEDLGEHRVKNIMDPVRVYRVNLENTATDGMPRRSPVARLALPSKPSIAVMPFTNMGSDSEQGYFSHGITEDIITELSRFHSLFVIARNSSFAYQDKPLNVQQIGRELGVQYVLEGSVRKAGKRLRITAQLVDASNGTHLWAERYDRDMEDIFAVQDEVTQTIVSTLAGRLESAVLERAKRKPTENMAAYDYLLRGMDHFNRLTTQDNVEAGRLFKKAIELDPQYAIAYAYLASTYLYDWFWKVSLEPLDEQAHLMAKKAIGLDDGESRSHMVYGRVQLYGRNFRQAFFHHERGVALNPNDADTAAQMGLQLAFAGRPDEGVEWLEKAMRLNPYHPDWYYEDLGQALYSARRYEEACRVLERVMAPPFWVVVWLAACYAQLDRLADAQRLASDVQATVKGIDWGRYVRDKEPFESEADMNHWLDGLRKAGFPV